MILSQRRQSSTDRFFLYLLYTKNHCPRFVFLLGKFWITYFSQMDIHTLPLCTCCVAAVR